MVIDQTIEIVNTNPIKMEKTLCWWEYITCNTPVRVAIATLTEWCKYNGISTQIPFPTLVEKYNQCVEFCVAEAKEKYDETIWSLKYSF